MSLLANQFNQVIETKTKNGTYLFGQFTFLLRPTKSEDFREVHSNIRSSTTNRVNSDLRGDGMGQSDAPKHCSH